MKLSRILILLFSLFMLSCSGEREKIRFGIITPSIDHLPLTYAINRTLIPKDQVELVPFTSGWEANEALIHGKIDMAILPFTFIWSDVSKGFPVKRLSSFERESDGIISRKSITDPKALAGNKIGMLRASTLDALMHGFSVQHEIPYTPVYFRTPSEIVAALDAGGIDAAVLYVPILQTLASRYHVVHYFGEDHPDHPCCDLAVYEPANRSERNRIHDLYKQLLIACQTVRNQPDDVVSFTAEYYHLTVVQSREALQHVGFTMESSPGDMNFENQVAKDLYQMGYLKTVPHMQQVMQP